MVDSVSKGKIILSVLFSFVRGIVFCLQNALSIGLPGKNFPGTLCQEGVF